MFSHHIHNEDHVPSVSYFFLTFSLFFLPLMPHSYFIFSVCPFPLKIINIYMTDTNQQIQGLFRSHHPADKHKLVEVFTFAYKQIKLHVQTKFLKSVFGLNPAIY